MRIIFYPRKPTSEERKKERKKERHVEILFCTKKFRFSVPSRFLLHVLATCRVSLCVFRRVEPMFSRLSIALQPTEIVCTDDTLNPFKKKRKNVQGLQNPFFIQGNFFLYKFFNSEFSENKTNNKSRPAETGVRVPDESNAVCRSRLTIRQYRWLVYGAVIFLHSRESRGRIDVIPLFRCLVSSSVWSNARIGGCSIFQKKKREG